MAQKSQFHRSLSQSQEWPISTYPILLDRFEQSSSLGEYFWQDLFVAKQIITSNPLRHVDVGSRIDGFIAHLLCTREVEVFDIRPLNISIVFDISSVGYFVWIPIILITLIVSHVCILWSILV